MATGTIVSQMESVLSATITDMHVRNEVGDCIQDMLLDLETTHHLQQQLELESTQRLLEKAQTEQQGVTLEAHTERLERYDRRVDLADHFVVELLELNREMKELLAWKEAHEHKVKDYDTVLAKLAKTEEELRDANTRVPLDDGATKSSEQSEARTEDNVEQSLSSGENLGNMPKPAATLETTTEETTTGTMATTTTAATPEGEPDSARDESPTEAAQKPVPSTEGGPETIQSVEDDQKLPASDAAVVSIDVEADTEEDVPTLMTLEMEPLMTLFAFLDAMDILNTAQVNLTMYNKVDNIFGISEDGQSPPAPTPARKPPPAPSKTTASGPSTNATTAASNYATKQTNPAATTAPPSTSTAQGGMGTGLFSMLQPAKPEAVAPPAAKAPAASSSSSQQQSQPLNAKVAQSMASKLSDAELAAIISMTDKLSKLEKEVHVLRNEKEMFAGKLEGTEAVKQFLIGKVRDVEVKLQRSKEGEIKVTQQIASDQEVIAFLDSRVQELEQQTENLTLEKTGTQAGFDDLKMSSSKKITMLSDMLKYEREKVREDESDWKATKKVLVKEVKSCRNQILALQAERDGLKEQNDMLKRAIVSNSGKHHNGNGGGRKSSGSPKT